MIVRKHTRIPYKIDWELNDNDIRIIFYDQPPEFIKNEQIKNRKEIRLKRNKK